MTCPERLGRYRVEQRLGSGGFGTVYQGLDEATGRRVAIKVLHPEHWDRLDAVLRFEREIRVLGRIRHPHIVDVVDVGEGWFAMELLSGIDLRRHMAEAGRLSIEQALAVLEPLAAALEAAHAKGVVHRDLKASNVFLDARRVVLLDFGVAKLLDDTGPQLTTSRMIVGSPACLSPEQILGLPVDARTDVYGLGVLAYHMLTGAPPYSHESPTIVQEMHLLKAPPCVSRKAPVRPEVDRAICRAMSKEAEDRQASVQDFVRELRDAAAGVRVRAAQQALAVHVDAPDDVLDDTVRTLTAQGMEVAFEAGNAVTLLLGLPADREANRRRRRQAVSLVRGCAAEASVVLGAGDPATLLRLGSWVPETLDTGVLAMPAVVEGLDVVTEPVPGSALLKLVNR